MNYSFDGKSYRINGKRVWLHVAEIHYFRFAAKEWRRAMNIAKAAGCNTISTYAAWNYHETSEGVWDFSGDKDIAEFIDTAKDLGLYVIVRPGPYICAEWSGGGLPSWTMQYESIENRVNNPVFMELTEKWLHRVLSYVVPRQITRGGNVISVQNDNEYPGGWDKKSESYVLSIYNLLRKEGVDVAITACNAHYKNNKLAINYACGADFQKLYEDITITYNTAGEPGVIPELKAMQPDRPTIVTELWTGRQVYWGKPIGKGFSSLAARILNFTALQAQTVLYMFQGGTNFGYYGSCDIATSYSSSYPVFEGGIPTPDYFDAKLAGAFLATFGERIADCTVESDDKYSSVQHTTDGDLVYRIFQEGQYDFTYENHRYHGSNPSNYFITPVRFSFAGHCIDYTDLCLLAKHDDVLYLYGNAGDEATLSVDGIEQTLFVKRHGIQVIDLQQGKIIVCDRYYAQRLWILDEHTVLLGGFLAYTDKGETVLQPCPLESKTVRIHKGEVTYSEHRFEPKTEPLPVLKDWQTDASFPTIQTTPVSRPLAMHLHGNYLGYMWYTAQVESDCDKTSGLMLSCYSGRILTYLNGKFAGIFGDKHDGGRMRWNYQKPTDSFNERVLLDLKKGINHLVFLAEDTGYSFDDIKPLGIMGEAYADTSLRLIESPRYIGETTLCQEAKEFLYSAFTYQRESYHTLEFDVDLHEDETFFLVVHGHPCWVTVNGQTAPPIRQANKMWQLFAHTVIWVSYEVKNPCPKNTIRIQYIGAAEDLISNTRIYIAKRSSRLTDWAVGKFCETVEFTGRKDFENNSEVKSTLLVPSGDCSSSATDVTPKYFTTTFEGDHYGPLFLSMGKMKKGQIFLNGHNLGRFHGTLPQPFYYIPDAYLLPHNQLTIFEEYGITPQDVKLVYPAKPYEDLFCL